MSKIAIVYWSGTGNTAAMAQIIAGALTAAGADVTELGANQFSAVDVSAYDAIAFGCPSMGAEVLEETIFQPMWDEVKLSLAGKKIGLFGSWGWGGGAWMEDWRADAEAAGANIAAIALANNAPDAAAEEECRALANALV